MTDTLALARRLREHALRMVSAVNASHIGSCLSMADLLAVLYGGVLNLDPANPTWPDRDRFIVSKGHAAAIAYAAVAERGFVPVETLATYCHDGSPLTGHISHHVPGVEVSTGSLGHGLPIGAGMALAGQRDGATWRTVVILSDGELDEGSNWEAILFAGHHRLSNLVAVIDANEIQSLGRVADVLDLDPLADKFRAFRWGVREIDGHDHQAIREAFTAVPFAADRPSVVIAHTVKGKGVPFMEDRLAWHYRAPLGGLLDEALAAVNGGERGAGSGVRSETAVTTGSGVELVCPRPAPRAPLPETGGRP